MKKRLCFLLAALALCVLVTACGLLENYKDLELPDISASDLEELNAGNVKFSYPKEGWTVSDDGNPTQLFYNDTIGGNMQVNVTVSYGGETDRLTKSDLALLKTQTLGKDMSYMGTAEADFRMLGDEKVIYIELKLEDKDEYIDFLLKQLGLSEDDLDALGGRKAFRESLPEFRQVMVAFIRDGRVVSVCGTFETSKQEKDVLTLISAVYETLKIK